MSESIWLFNVERQTWYRLDHVLDSGGEGQVWAGVVHPSELPVAVKIIHPSANLEQVIASWFHDQDIHLKCLGHSGVVQTYDQFRSQDGYWVLVMERAIGNLESLLTRRRSLTPLAVCSFGYQILRAVDHLHSLGVIHRDLTPKNILLFEKGVVKISDFGVSKADLPPQAITRTLLGSRHYLPPELHALGHWSRQSDIYQVGLVMLSLLVGKHVISPLSPESEVKRLILDGIPRQMAEALIPSCGDLARIIYYMVCRTESLRYVTAESAGDDVLMVWKDLWKHRQPVGALASKTKTSSAPFLSMLGGNYPLPSSR